MVRRIVSGATPPSVMALFLGKEGQKDKKTERPNRNFQIVLSGQFCTLAMFCFCLPLCLSCPYQYIFENTFNFLVVSYFWLLSSPLSLSLLLVVFAMLQISTRFLVVSCFSSLFLSFSLPLF